MVVSARCRENGACTEYAIAKRYVPRDDPSRTIDCTRQLVCSLKQVLFGVICAKITFPKNIKVTRNFIGGLLDKRLVTVSKPERFYISVNRQNTQFGRNEVLRVIFSNIIIRCYCLHLISRGTKSLIYICCNFLTRAQRICLRTIMAAIVTKWISARQGWKEGATERGFPLE